MLVFVQLLLLFKFKKVKFQDVFSHNDPWTSLVLSKSLDLSWKLCWRWRQSAMSLIDAVGGYNTQFISSVGLINWRSIGPEVNLCADLTHCRSSLSSLHPPLLLSHALVQRKTGQLVHVFLHRWPVAPVPTANWLKWAATPTYKTHSTCLIKAVHTAKDYSLHTLI